MRLEMIIDSTKIIRAFCHKYSSRTTLSQTSNIEFISIAKEGIPWFVLDRHSFKTGLIHGPGKIIRLSPVC